MPQETSLTASLFLCVASNLVHKSFDRARQMRHRTSDKKKVSPSLSFCLRERKKKKMVWEGIYSFRARGLLNAGILWPGEKIKPAKKFVFACGAREKEPSSPLERERRVFFSEIGPILWLHKSLQGRRKSGEKGMQEKSVQSHGRTKMGRLRAAKHGSHWRSAWMNYLSSYSLSTGALHYK